jgi:hypothetical protein
MEQNESITKSQREELISQKIKEQGVCIKYLKQMTALNMESVELKFKYEFAEELFNENRISDKLKDELLNEIHTKNDKLRIKQSDLVKEALANGVNRKEFIDYILD